MNCVRRAVKFVINLKLAILYNISFTTIKKNFKRHPWKIGKVLKYFETTLFLWHCCESQARNVFMTEIYKFSQTLDSLFIYSFKELMRGWNEKLNFVEMNLFKKENLSSNCRRHSKMWSNGHLFRDCHQPSPKATGLLPTHHFLPVPPIPPTYCWWPGSASASGQPYGH